MSEYDLVSLELDCKIIIIYMWPPWLIYFEEWRMGPSSISMVCRVGTLHTSHHQWEEHLEESMLSVPVYHTMYSTSYPTSK